MCGASVSKLQTNTTQMASTESRQAEETEAELLDAEVVECDDPPVDSDRMVRFLTSAPDSEVEECDEPPVDSDRMARFLASAASSRSKMQRETGKLQAKHEGFVLQFGQQHVDDWYDEHQRETLAATTESDASPSGAPPEEFVPADAESSE